MTLVFLSCKKSNPLYTNSCDFINSQIDIDKNKKADLVLISGVGCGYCERALKQLEDLDRESTNIIVYEIGSKVHIEKMHSKYFSKYAFIEADSCDMFDDIYFPTYYLFIDGKQIWKRKGFYENTVDVVHQKINKQHRI